MNVPPSIGMAQSVRAASWEALGSTLGLEDLHDLLEVARVDAHNARVIDDERCKREEG